MRLESQSELDAWLEANFWLHDASVVALSPLPAATSIPIEARITFEFAVAGGYQAGDEQTIRRIELAVRDLQNFSLDPHEWNPEHCSEGLDSVETSDSVGFAIDVPGMLRIACWYIEILSNTDSIKRVPAWLSETEFSVYSPRLSPSTPSDWLERFAQEGHDVVWRCYAGEEQVASQIPPDAYAGWFVQYRERLNNHTGGLLFDWCEVQNGGYSITVRLNDPDCRQLWITAGRFLASLPDTTIRCGNAILSSEDFELHLMSESTRGPSRT